MISPESFTDPSKLPAFFLYFSLGYYLHKTEVNKNQRKIIYGLGISSLVMGYVLTKQASLLQDGLNMHYFSNSTLTVFFVSVMVFVLIKHSRNQRSRCIEIISKHSFGMYLIHALFLDKLFTPIQLSYPLAYVSTFLIAVMVFVLSLVGSYIGSKIPYVNKFLF
jgi:surface polysaccharide O-acyltransferase-like enzyme